jgi:hypothetical protein
MCVCVCVCVCARARALAHLSTYLSYLPVLCPLPFIDKNSVAQKCTSVLIEFGTVWNTEGV